MAIRNLRLKYPDRVPVKLIPSPELSLRYHVYKFLPKYDSRVYDLLRTLRSRIHLRPSESIYFLADNELLIPDRLMGQIELEYCKDRNEAVEIIYTIQESFG